MSTDVNKLAEEYADEVRWVPPSMSVDELKNEIIKTHQAGFRAALECEEVREMRSVLGIALTCGDMFTQKLALEGKDAFDRLLEEVK